MAGTGQSSMRYFEPLQQCVELPPSTSGWEPVKRNVLSRGHYLAVVIFILGNVRLTAATTEAYSGFPELLAKASRA